MFVHCSFHCSCAPMFMFVRSAVQPDRRCTASRLRRFHGHACPSAASRNIGHELMPSPFAPQARRQEKRPLIKCGIRMKRMDSHAVRIFGQIRQLLTMRIPISSPQRAAVMRHVGFHDVYGLIRERPWPALGFLFHVTSPAFNASLPESFYFTPLRQRPRPDMNFSIV